MAWFAVSTRPGSQKPKREYAVEATSLGKNGRPRGKGYRITPNINHSISAIELSLVRNGFDVYMPAEKRLVRDRRHTDLWKVRRFALMVGYVFVQNPHDWRLLTETDGVSGVVKTADGTPLPIELEDILMLRIAEAEAEEYFDIQSKKARQILRKKAKTDPRLTKLIGKLDMAGKITVPLHGEILAA